MKKNQGNLRRSLKSYSREDTHSGAKHTNSSLRRYSSVGESWLVYTKKSRRKCSWGTVIISIFLLIA